jgi:hypothetical protein
MPAMNRFSLLISQSHPARRLAVWDKVGLKANCRNIPIALIDPNRPKEHKLPLA